jgi:hypothetical protein
MKEDALKNPLYLSKIQKEIQENKKFKLPWTQ